MSHPNSPAGTSPSRRTFLQSAAAGTAAAAISAKSYARVQGANQRIAVGLIGCGNRGFGRHLPGIKKHAREENVEVTAVCDVWSKHRERAAEQVKQSYGRAPFTSSNYQDLLDRPDVDAVMIASCDFHHAKMLEETAQAKKDAYCEKPLSMDVDELASACRAVQQNEILVQIGTQRRSDPLLNACREVCQSGKLGKINRIEIISNGARPNWYKRLTRLPIKASEVDWARFLMHRPPRPFSDRLFAGWFGYREFCSGSIGQFMSHYVDLVNFLTGSTFPTSAVGHGDTFVWKDDYQFDCREQLQVSLIYPEQFFFNYVTNFGNGSGSRQVVYGTQGILEMSSSRATISPAGAYGKSQIQGQTKVKPLDCPDHFLNWLQCLRTRQRPAAPLEAGYQHSVACIMADQAMQTGQRQMYDAQRREIRAG